MNKQSPEYIRVREEIAKKFYQVHRGIVNTEKARNLFSREDELNQAFYLLLADSILEIKGIAILADSQTYGEVPHLINLSHPYSAYTQAQSDMLKSNFKKVVE
jgi:hypothetical protein